MDMIRRKLLGVASSVALVAGLATGAVRWPPIPSRSA